MSQHKDEFIDVVSENFVNAYINEFNPKIIEWYLYGTPKENKISRYRQYCEIWQDGYPKWFYVYFLQR